MYWDIVIYNDDGDIFDTQQVNNKRLGSDVYNHAIEVLQDSNGDDDDEEYIYTFQVHLYKVYRNGNRSIINKKLIT